MLKFVWTSKRNNVENIGFRNSYITGKVKEDQGNGKYKVEIAGSDKDYPNIFTIQTDPTYAVNEFLNPIFSILLLREVHTKLNIKNTSYPSACFYLAVFGNINIMDCFLD